MEDIGCKKYQKPQKHSNVWKKRRLAFVLKQELPAGASEWMRDERGVGDPQTDFSDLLLIILRWPYLSSQLFITIFHHLKTIWKYFEARELFWEHQWNHHQIFCYQPVGNYFGVGGYLLRKWFCRVLVFLNIQVNPGQAGRRKFPIIRSVLL